MGSQYKPLLEMGKFGFADNIRGDRQRLPGMCRSIVNTAPNLSGAGERVRRGYTAYTAVTAPSGTQILQVAPIQSPSQQDVHIWFSTNGIYMNPYWDASSTPTASNYKIGETKSFTGAAGSYPTAYQITFTGSDALGLSQATDYYKNWSMWNVTRSKASLITAYSYSSAAAGTSTFTIVEIRTAIGFLFTDSYILNRHYHPAFGAFTPTYNTTLTDPPFVNSVNSIIRFSGGQGSTTTLRPSYVAPYINKTFFPSASAPFTYSGTYIGKRELLPPVSTHLIDQSTGLFIGSAGGVNGLAVGYTYWIALAFIYDGFQIGQLLQFSSSSNYAASGISGWTENYLAPGGSSTSFIQIPLILRSGEFDKRITGIAIYAAQDSGDTRSIGRQTQLFYIDTVSLVDNSGRGKSWASFGGSDAGFSNTTGVNGTAWNGKGNDYTTDSGIVESPSDIMYSYSDEVIVGTQHFLSNVYINSETLTNRQQLFTNPLGGNANINAGLWQPDIFSNEDGFYRLRVQPTIGTKINGMRITGLEDLLVLKDRGVLHGRLIQTDGIPDFTWSVLSHDIGCSTLRGHSFSDDAWIYFAGYDDIYRYRNGGFQRLIEDVEAQNDWLYTYRELLSKTMKESVACFYVPDRQVIFDIGQSAGSGKQMSFFPDYGWREVKLNQSSGNATTFVKWTTRLQNGTVLVVDSSGNIYQWSNPTTGAFYKDDNGTAIIPYLDTGSFIPSGDEAFDTILNYWALSRTFDAATVGQLDIDLYKDGSLLRSYTSQDKTSIFLPINSVVSDARQGNTWRLVINSNTSTPEHLNAGTILTLNKIFLYGELRKRSKRASEHSAGFSTTPLSGCVSNTVSAVQEVTLNRAPATFTWDAPFTKTYTSPTEGVGTPSYVIKADGSPYVIGSDKSQVPLVTISAKTLTTFTAYASEDNVKFHFEATE